MINLKKEVEKEVKIKIKPENKVLLIKFLKRANNTNCKPSKDLNHKTIKVHFSPVIKLTTVRMQWSIQNR